MNFLRIEERGIYMLRIIYEKKSNGLFEVKLICLEQIILVSAEKLFRCAEIERDVLLGCKDVTIETLLYLGFVFPVVADL